MREGAAPELQRISSWCEAHQLRIGEALDLEPFAGGQSNPTYALHTSTGRYVIRRKPAGRLLKGAHAIEREARVQRALREAAFPVPEVLAVCEDPNVIGAPFYIMTLVDGRLFWRSSFDEASASERPALFDAMNRTLARLHGISPSSIGLQDYGRPERYLARQIGRWSAQYLADSDAGRLVDLDVTADWLPGVAPNEDRTAIVHGDFRVDNLIFSHNAAEVAAVIDWELSTLGDPLADFAYHLMMYYLPPSFPGGLLGVDLAAIALPSEAEYVARYCERTGRGEIAILGVYIAYNLFRFAAIVHGIKGRMLRGNASSADAQRLVDQLPLLATIARQQAVRAGMPV